MAGIIEQLREAQRLYRSADQVVASAIAQITGMPSTTTASTANATTPRRGRPPGTTTAPRVLDANGLVAKLSAAIPGTGMTRAEIIKLTGWGTSSANLQLGRLVKNGKLVVQDGRYIATVSEPQQAA